MPTLSRSEDEAAIALADFDILLTMRERTAFPETLIRRLPKLRMIGITGAIERLAGRRGLHASRNYGLQHDKRAVQAPLTPRRNSRSA